VIDRPTDHATRSVTIGRIYVRSTAMGSNNNNKWSNYKFGIRLHRRRRQTVQSYSPCGASVPFLLSSAGRATGLIAPKICQGQPQTVYSECSRFHPNRFTFGGVIHERVNTVKTSRKVFGQNWISVISSMFARFSCCLTDELTETLATNCVSNYSSAFFRRHVTVQRTGTFLHVAGTDVDMCNNLI